MKKILFATSNNHKFNEVKDIVSKFNANIELISLNDLNDNNDVKEDGFSFSDNAIIKAKFYHCLYNYPTISDDSGICIDYFGGLPAVHSARFLKNFNYSEKADFIINVMKHVNNRKAHYETVVAYIDNENIKTYSGILKGSIALKKDGDNGFGYDPIFIPDCFDETLAKLPEGFKNTISHRKIAIENWLKDYEKNS